MKKFGSIGNINASIERQYFGCDQTEIFVVKWSWVIDYKNTSFYHGLLACASKVYNSSERYFGKFHMNVSPDENILSSALK